MGVVHIIGEAARATSQEFKARYPEIPWRDASDVRNLTIHEYFRINLDIIWDLVENDIPPLKRQIEAILRELI
ncbi:HepT-like ribonuclease domain-containing protein [Rippkaea orientalis]|uniref:HepT-like ribonuclease domain-containing protein n=1 Tax=Rippkaea orientalis TaxID=2546366 RepID=UPI000A016791